VKTRSRILLKLRLFKLEQKREKEMKNKIHTNYYTPKKHSLYNRYIEILYLYVILFLNEKSLNTNGVCNLYNIYILIIYTLNYYYNYLVIYIDCTRAAQLATISCTISCTNRAFQLHTAAQFTTHDTL